MEVHHNTLASMEVHQAVTDNSLEVMEDSHHTEDKEDSMEVLTEDTVDHRVDKAAMVDNIREGHLLAIPDSTVIVDKVGRGDIPGIRVVTQVIRE